MDYVYLIAAGVVAYLIGSLSFAVIVSKAFGLDDPRTYGSKNPGATNVLRSGSKKAAIVTLILDALKGFVPVLLVQLFGASFGLDDGALALVAFAAFLGHLYPVFFGFKGGKGVATAAGVAFGLHWALGLVTLACFAIVVFLSRYVSLASMVAALFAPFAYLMGDRGLWYVNKPVVAALFAIALLLIWRHRENINRLLKGTESKLGAKKG
jgi:acyl phosphate:glycerol-3-phosphate acyltransferase